MAITTAALKSPLGLDGSDVQAERRGRRSGQAATAAVAAFFLTNSISLKALALVVVFLLLAMISPLPALHVEAALPRCRVLQLELRSHL